MNASEMWAAAWGKPETGTDRCHWCGGRSGRKRIHADPGPRQFIKQPWPAKHPGSIWVCEGCWQFNRGRITVTHLDGSTRDGGIIPTLDWWVEPDKARVVRKEDHGRLWELLLKPPLQFCLALTTGVPHQVHFLEANDKERIDADTLLAFTVDNRRLEYSVYELGEAIKGGTQGKLPGVRVLIDMLGMRPAAPVEEKRERGRPKLDLDPLPPSQKVVTPKEGKGKG